MTFLKEKIVFSILLSLLFLSCYEYKEGCLDQLSKNYDLEADENCLDCCTYPSINLSIGQFIIPDSLVGIDTTILVNDFGQKYKLKNALFILNNFKWTIENQEITVRDSTLFLDNDLNEMYKRDDYVIVRTGQVAASIGSVREIGNISQISCDLGINHNCKVKEETHILAKNDSLYTNTSYQNFVLNIQFGDNLEKEKSYTLNGIDNVINYTISLDTNKIARTDLSLLLRVQYYNLLNKIDFENTSQSQFEQQFKNTSNFLKFN